MDDWLITSAFLTTHIWPINYQSEIFTVDLNTIIFLTSFFLINYAI
jgi:hypothetical protein